MTAWAIGVAAWFYAVAEMIGMWRLWPWAYRSGFKVLEEQLPISPARVFPTEVVELNEAKVRSAASNILLFRATFSRFFQTPFPIKCTVVRNGSSGQVIGRIPLGTTAFLGAWLVGWTVGALTIPMKGDQSAASFLLTGWGVVVLMAAISLPIEFRRVRRARDSVVGYLR
jgi:hypothetical protein